METPQRSKAIFQGSSTCCYGSPPLCFGRSQSYGDSSHHMLMSVDGSSSRDTDMQHVMTQMRNVQLEETKVEETLWQPPPPFETPEHHHQSQVHSQQRLPFQAFAFNRRPRQHDDACFPLSPPLNLSHRHAAENVKPSHHHDVGLLPQQERTRSNSFLVHNAPLLPASPDLDLCGRDVLGRSNQP
ncbi:hypothetical protein MPSEU_000452900 [Mayamaea pseudoterrestris]|nr:hypothetical protein MPSEU_000452900 [Mayamaea pseudoterrestris]